jgi:hypothetical protein
MKVVISEGFTCRFPTPIYAVRGWVRQFRNWSIDLIVVWLFAGNAASNVRVVGAYLGTFRGHVFKIPQFLIAGEVSKATSK